MNDKTNKQVSLLHHIISQIVNPIYQLSENYQSIDNTLHRILTK